MKPKDLVGIPWMVAFALRADGWYLRRDVIWAKPNPMPESITDRPTSSHEYVFLLSKSARYFYDADAVREGYANGLEAARPWAANGGVRNVGGRADGLARGTAPEWEPTAAGRNLRSVWTIATEPYPGSHFATFPRKLVEPCVKAGTSERGVCPECGAPWERITTPSEGGKRSWHDHTADLQRGQTTGGGAREFASWRPPTTLDWQPTCRHDAEPVPAVVLDPFAGSGTTGLVAQSLRRRAVLVDLNPAYLRQALRRASRRFGIGGRELADDGQATPPADSLWAPIADEAAS